jgi:prepilin-type processing-associated H-X9-DG protein
MDATKAVGSSSAEVAMRWGRLIPRLGCLALLLAAGVPFVWMCRDLLDPPPPKRPWCISNLKQLALAAMMYAEDYDQHFPSANDWSGPLFSHITFEDVYRCPSFAGKPGYALNSLLGGRDWATVHNQAQIALFFDSGLGYPSASGGPGALASPPRHAGSNVVAFVDGHVKSMRETPSFGVEKGRFLVAPGPAAPASGAAGMR